MLMLLSSSLAQLERSHRRHISPRWPSGIRIVFLFEKVLLCWQAEVEEEVLTTGVFDSPEERDHYHYGRSSRGFNLIRFFGSINGNGSASGYGDTGMVGKEILVSINKTTLQGTYNESGLQRFDLVLSSAGE